MLILHVLLELIFFPFVPTKTNNFLHKEYLRLCPIPKSNPLHYPKNNDRALPSRLYRDNLLNDVATIPPIRHPNDLSVHQEATNPALIKANDTKPRDDVRHLTTCQQTNWPVDNAKHPSQFPKFFPIPIRCTHQFFLEVLLVLPTAHPYQHFHRQTSYSLLHNASINRALRQHRPSHFP